MKNLVNLFFTFFMIGSLGFGGGYAMMSMIIAEASKFGVSLTQMADLTALEMVIPGPIAINAATYVGYLSQGWLGSLFATVGVILPSFILISLVMHFLEKFKENKIMIGILAGIKPAAVGLIAAASLTIAGDVLFTSGTLDIIKVLLFIGCAAINIKYKTDPILLTLLCGLLGAFIFA